MYKTGPVQKGRLPPGRKVKNGKIYTESNPSQWMLETSRISRLDHLLLFLLLAIGVAVRLYNLPLPSGIVFDEIHLGNFIDEYYKGTFFIDVHPPLGKLLYFWIASLLNWDGEYEFSDVNAPYDSGFPYLSMRMFSATCGIISILATYGTLRASLCRPLVAFFGAYLVAIENANITLTRQMMLEGPLILGISLTLYTHKKFELAKPFTKKWFKFLISTGIFLGILTSIKLTGLFTFLWVGVNTAIELWNILGDLDVTLIDLFKHIIYRVFGLIVIPATIYLGCFAMHFVNLPYNGSGSGAISPSFQASFMDAEDLTNMPVEVSYGSTVTIKHNELESYLHSHDHIYKTGSGEQQVTLYGFSPDVNNEWIIETKNKNRMGLLQEKFRPVKDGDTVRFYHKVTGKYLHVNDLRPPLSEHDYANEVSCAGDRDMLGDINYEFKIRILLKKSHSNLSLPLIKLRATESVFQILHRGTECVLLAHEDQLPSWGFYQNEVLCVDEPTIPNSLWYIEHNSHPLLDDNYEYERAHFKNITFWDKLTEYHKAMWRTNKGLNEPHYYSSQPISWMLTQRGISLYNTEGDSLPSGDKGRHIYLLGNLAIYSIGLAITLVILINNFVHVVKIMNPFQETPEQPYESPYYKNGLLFIFGYALNYLPYFLMSRQLFLHHYLIPSYFLILAVALFAEYQISRRRILGYIFVAIVLFFATANFWKLKHIIYGLEWTKDDCNHAKWLGTWDFNCDSYSQ